MLIRNNYWWRKEVPDFHRIWSTFPLRPWLEIWCQSYIKMHAYYSFQTRPGSRPGFRALTGLPSQIFLKNQNDIVLVKKKNKSQRFAIEFLTGSCRVTSGFSLPYFFFNSPRFQPQVDSPGRAGFQNYDAYRESLPVKHRKSCVGGWCAVMRSDSL